MDTSGNTKMSIEQKAKAYDEAVKIARCWLNAPQTIQECNYTIEDAIQNIFPELRESEDERIRKELIFFLKEEIPKCSIKEHADKLKKFVSYLEKQKYDRMKPIYDARESFESALEKAWNDYHNGYENVDKLEDDYVKCAHAKGFREGYLFGIEKQKKQKPILEVFGFKVGDAVRLKNGDGRKHIIKSFEEVEGIHGPNFYHVEFEDNSARDGIYPGKEYPNGYYTQMEKFEQEQEPAEWSEENERMLSRCIKSIECSKMFAEAKTFKDAKDNEIDWLENRFKSLRPSWKPSEEQMNALNFAITYMFSTKANPTVLRDLYNDLLKLK